MNNSLRYTVDDYHYRFGNRIQPEPVDKIAYLIADDCVDYLRRCDQKTAVIRITYNKSVMYRFCSFESSKAVCEYIMDMLEKRKWRRKSLVATEYEIIIYTGLF